MEVREAATPQDWETVSTKQLLDVACHGVGLTAAAQKRIEQRMPELAAMGAKEMERKLRLTRRASDRLFAAVQLGARAAARATAKAGRVAVRGPEDVLPLVRDLVHSKREHFVVLLLNARHEFERRETVSIGSLNASIVHPREVFVPAILHSAASLVIVHNHPSGDPEPSEEDLSITKRLVEVGELCGIGILDHVIVAKRGTVSFRARQLL